ncbi:hypothetical protein DMX03_24410 [Pseudomonas koreensis]|uniref:hypothetical protein n=1 Tax=Pseudomonas sp. H26/SER47-MNA-CIBAN-0231 TaxID=3140477 RepID=UPI000D921043|nr:hypothetical protein DMX03_24410 [Pseudomonas koreensis]
MNSVSVAPAPGNLLEVLSKLGSAIVGLSVFAYIAGYAKLMSMYSSINAGWLIDFVVTQDILRAGLEPLAMVGVTGAASAYILSTKSWIVLKMLTFSIFSLLLIYLKFMPSNVLVVGWFESYKFSTFISYFLYLVSGIFISYSVFEVVVGKAFGVKVLMCFFVGALFSLYVTPVYLGKVWANSIVSGDMNFSKAVGEQYKNESCYLFGSVNSKYLIGCVSGNKVGRIQLVEVGKDIAFERK